MSPTHYYQIYSKTFSCSKLVTTPWKKLLMFEIWQSKFLFMNFCTFHYTKNIYAWNIASNKLSNISFSYWTSNALFIYLFINHYNQWIIETTLKVKILTKNNIKTFKNPIIAFYCPIALKSLHLKQYKSQINKQNKTVNII